MIESLDVMLWGRKVGTLLPYQKGYTQQAYFYFDREYAKGGYDVSPLRCPLSGINVQKGLPVYPEEGKAFGGLPAFLSDSLPDHWGNILFAEWARNHHIRMKDLSVLDKLAYIGRRGIGALEFVPPASDELETPFKVEISELAHLANQALKEAKNFHARLNQNLVIESLFKVGTSAGGRRPKAVINLNPETGECFSGQVPAPQPDFVPTIIKFDEHIDIPTTRIEYSYYLMALAAGMNMMPSDLLEGQKESHFLTMRFDRKGNDKIHIQSLAAINPLSSSYEDLFEAATGIGIGPDEARQLFIQMVMNVICGNVDDHNKNFSFMMDKDAVWHVTPAYDFTFTIDPSSPSYVNRHSLTINSKYQNITKYDLLEIANRYDIKGAAAIIDNIVDTAGNYRTFAEQAGIPDRWIRLIEKEMEASISGLEPV